MEGIAYQNKDVTSKVLGEGLKDKSLEVYGIHLPKIVDVKPTNLPAIAVNELRLDNLFEFADGSYGIVDYESQFNEKDKITYLNYISRVLDKLAEQGITPNLHMIVLYTCGVENVNTTLDVGCLHLKVEPGYLSGINWQDIFQKLEKKIKDHKLLDDKELMEMIVLPLSCPKEKQNYLLKRTVELAKDIEDENQQLFVLSGILAFSDKIIDNDYAEEVRRWIQMTKVERIIEREQKEAFDAYKQESEKREMALKMLLKGDSLANIIEKTGFTEDEILELTK